MVGQTSCEELYDLLDDILSVDYEEGESAAHYAAKIHRLIGNVLRCPHGVKYNQLCPECYKAISYYLKHTIQRVDDAVFQHN